MTNQDAKFILQAYRHDGSDAADPVFAEALEQVSRDPELARWFAEERELDAAISRKLKEVAVPSELETKILAGRNLNRPRNGMWRRVALPLAACLALLLGLAVYWLPQRGPDAFAVYREDMTEFLTTRFNYLDYENPNLGEVQQWLAQRDAHGDLVVPTSLSRFPSMGCRVLDWNGRKVTIICFKPDGPKEVHLFVVDRDGLSGPPPEDEPRFAKSGNWMTASWSHGNKAYMLAGVGDPALLRRFF